MKLVINQVDCFHGAIQALRGVSLSINEGEIVSLIGANGAGKSSLLMSICGHPSPRNGEIIFEGQNLAGFKTHEIMRLGIAQVPEGRRIFPRMTVLENITLGAALADPSWFNDDLKMVHELFPRLAERTSQRAGTLSGGEQQMLAIGRALMSRPHLLLLDEPSLGLAPLIVKQIFQILSELNRSKGMTILLVEQNALQALKIAHRGYVLQHGELVMQGTGKELLADPRVRSAYLGAH